MLKIREIIQKHELLCSDESKRLGKSKKKNKDSKKEEPEIETIETSFKTLDID